MASTTVHQKELRKENIDQMVKGFALQSYTMRDLVMVNRSNSWKETYFQEDAEELKASGTRNIKGVPRLANFPYAEVNWEKKTSVMEKYALEGTIAYEDWLTNEIDVIARTLLRIGRGIAKQVDEEIYSVLSEDGSPENINNIAIEDGNEWNSDTVANRNPFGDILKAIREMQKHNYDPYTNETFLVLNPTDFANMMDNEKIQRMFTEEIGRNGRVGRLAGVTVKVSNTVPDDEALVAISGMCGTWKEVVPLTTNTTENPGISWTIKAWEIGVTQLTNPKAVTLITNTQE